MEFTVFSFVKNLQGESNTAIDVSTDTRFVINNQSSEHSPTYFALLKMIEKAWLLKAPSELEAYLETLQKQGFITGRENKFLFGLAMGKMKNETQPVNNANPVH